MAGPRLKRRLLPVLLVWLLCLRLPAAAITAPRTRVAVLPFAVSTNDPAMAVYAWGIMDTLIAALSHVPRFILVDRGRIELVVKSVEVGPAEQLGQLLGAQVLVTGSLVHAGSEARITAHFTDVATGRIVRSETITGPMDRIFALLDELAARFLSWQQVVLTGEQQQRFREVVQATTSRAAYEAYLEGREATLEYSEAGFTRAIRQYEHALSLDPKFALAYVGLASAAQGMAKIHGRTGRDPRPWVGRSQTAARQALALNYNLAGAHKAMGMIFKYDPDPRTWIRAVAEFKAAALITPNDDEIYLEWGGLSMRHRLPLLQLAVELNPYSFAGRHDLGVTYNRFRRFDEGLLQLDAAHRLHPQDSSVLTDMAEAETARNRWANAQALLNQALQAEPRLAEAHYLLSLLYMQQGRLREAYSAWQSAVKIDGRYRLAPPRGPYADGGAGLTMDEVGALEALGHWGDALAELSLLRQLYPREPQVERELGIALATVGRGDEGLPFLEDYGRQVNRANRANDEAIRYIDSLLAFLRRDTYP